MFASSAASHSSIVGLLSELDAIASLAASGFLLLREFLPPLIAMLLLAFLSSLRLLLDCIASFLVSPFNSEIHRFVAPM